MKKTIFSLFTAVLMAGCTNYAKTEKETPSDTLNREIDTIITLDPSRADTIEALATAFAMQESRCNEKAVSPCGRYKGALQISKIMVAEANRICGAKIFWCDANYDDRMDWQGSLAIFTTVMEYHNPTLDVDKSVDLWNHGASRTYRQNVKNNYARLLETWELYEN